MGRDRQDEKRTERRESNLLIHLIFILGLQCPTVWLAIEGVSTPEGKIERRKRRNRRVENQ